MKIELHDSSMLPPRVEIVEMPSVPRIGEAIAWSPDEAAFTVRSVIYVVGADVVQVRGW